jgi:DNA-binding transcriptional LysR family regulator
MNRLENMETFVSVVETGSITGTANRLHVAKSAVSRRLKELESYLGVELFHRTTRKMHLTDTGQTYYRDCLRIIDDIVESELTTTQAHSILKGNIKVALPSTFGLMHVGPAINDFSQTYPQITFDLDFNDREVDLMQEGFDLAIRIANLPDSSLIARRLAPINGMTCASPDYLKKWGTPQTLAELINHRSLVYTLKKDYEHWQFIDSNHHTNTIKLQPYMKASDGEYLREAAVKGMGITILPTFIAYQEIQNGTLITLLDQYRFPQLNAYAIYPPTRHLSQRVRTFIDFLAQRFSGTPYWDVGV